MRAVEFIIEKWTKKYKKSINCAHPKGFSQKAHCAGRKKHNEGIELPNYDAMFESKLMEFASAGGGAGKNARNLRHG